MTPAELDRLQGEYAARAMAAQAAASQALHRLLKLAEVRDTGQARCIAQFLAATYNGSSYSFDLFDLRSVDVEISDDMLICLDALRWGKADLYKLLPSGDTRIEAVCSLWEINPRAA
jgi:hypothetical protein